MTYCVKISKKYDDYNDLIKWLLKSVGSYGKEWNNTVTGKSGDDHISFQVDVVTKDPYSFEFNDEATAAFFKLVWGGE